MTDEQHIEAVRKFAAEVTALARKRAADSEKIRRAGRFAESQSLWELAVSSAALADSLSHVVELAERAVGTEGG